MSHLRISSDTCFSPQIAKNQAHMIIALEPTEALRVLANYGNAEVKVLCNKRPIHSVGVISGEQNYPELSQIMEWVNELSGQAWFIDATDQALEKMKNPIFSNIILLGALTATDSVPFNREDFEEVITASMPKDKIRILAKVVEGLVPGCVSIRHGHGFGHWAMGSVAKGKGAHSNNLMDTHTNPVTGANCYNECKVRVRPAN